MSKTKIVKLANQGLSLNSLNLPTGFYRADILPDEEDLLLQQQALQSSAAVIDAVKDVDVSVAEPIEVSDGQVDEEPVMDPDGLLAQQNEAVMLAEKDFRTRDHEEAQKKREGFVGAEPELLGYSQSQIVIPPHVIEAAYVPLDYSQGYPALDNGLPFWYQFDFEPQEAFVAFQVYLQQGLKGPRQLFVLSDSAQLQNLAKQSGLSRLPQAQINEWSILYYWAQRAKAFDLFNTAAIRKSRESLAMQLENQHYKDFTRMYERVMVKMSDDEFWANASFKETVQALDLIAKMQRISIGLSGGGPSGKDAEKDTRQHQSMETIMQNVAREQGNDSMTNMGRGNAATLVDLSDGNSKTFEALQEALLEQHNG